MTNPFTRFLNQWSRDPSFSEFVAYWDALEAVVVRVYRQKSTPQEAEEAFGAVWPWLRAHYGAFEAQLRPFWRQTKAAGQPTQTDPFELLLAIAQPADIVGDWRAMQHLPAAREAINKYLVSIEGK